LRLQKSKRQILFFAKIRQIIIFPTPNIEEDVAIYINKLLTNKI
jgi:hypothetical protein